MASMVQTLRGNLLGLEMDYYKAIVTTWFWTSENDRENRINKRGKIKYRIYLFPSQIQKLRESNYPPRQFLIYTPSHTFVISS